jgi:hypothetical protein
MGYINPRGLAIADMGTTTVALQACTLADYTTGGTTTPAVDDLVTFSATGDHFVKRCPSAQAAAIGRVAKVEKAPAGTDAGFVVVEWLDVERFLKLTSSNLTNVTRGNRAKKLGADTTANDWDATGATGSQLLVTAKAAASGSGDFLVAVLA